MKNVKGKRKMKKFNLTFLFFAIYLFCILHFAIFGIKIVRICKDSGMIKIGGIYIDGTKLRANASARRRYEI